MQPRENINCVRRRLISCEASALTATHTSQQSVEIDLQEEILLVFPSTLTPFSAESWSGDQNKD